jgi:hypothetical protein
MTLPPDKKSFLYAPAIGAKQALSRRSILNLAIAGGASLVSSRASLAQQKGPTDLGTLSDANIRPRPIAIPEFLSDDPKFGTDVANIVAANLDRSGLFKMIDRSAYIERFADLNQPPLARKPLSSAAPAKCPMAASLPTSSSTTPFCKNPWTRKGSRPRRRLGVASATSSPTESTKK